ncbi:sensor histidine kinase [Runella sp.]|uniref:sensor histidine kinase n=1 Tax=Runella sp. TaxID=1960881 RepID=UPI002634C417|nr:histidine kinase [Runella sp.]
MSSDLHDDVGTILSGLAMQSQMLAFSAKEEQKDSLLEISSMSHDAMERMRDTVWAIDSHKDKYENLIDRMRDFADRNLNRKQISHEFKVEVEDGKKFIDPQKRQNIYLIFKEAIVNIVKHSDATHVNIVFSEQRNRLHLVIHDNGSQLQTPTSSDGLGLSNMQMRATQLGGRLMANYEEGFKVELTLG